MKKVDFADGAEEICRNSQRYSTFRSVDFKFACETAGGWTKNFRHPSMCNFFFFSRKKLSINTLRERKSIAYHTKKCRRSLVSSWERIAATQPASDRTCIIIHIMRCTLEYTALKIMIAAGAFLEHRASGERKRGEDSVVWESGARAAGRPALDNSGVVPRAMSQSLAPKVTVRTRETLK